MASVKFDRPASAGLAIISTGARLLPGTGGVGVPGQPLGRTNDRTGFRMNLLWKKIFFLDFERSFLRSNLKLLFILNPLWTLLVAVIMGHQSWETVDSRWRLGLYEATVITLLAMALTSLYLLVERWWFARGAAVAPRHGTGWYLFFLALVVPPGIYLAFYAMVFVINAHYQVGEPIPFQVPWKYFETEIFWGWLLLLGVFAFKSWLDLRETAQHNLLRAEELEKERLRALLTKLQDQMNPHFLFNTLNTVAALIPQDPTKAEKVVVKLSSLLQGLLAATRKTRHSLKKELEFCRDYLEIEQARFGSRLKVQVKVEKGLDPARAMVPVMILQPMIENAIKHGLSSRASGGRLWVLCRPNDGKVEIRVEDDGVGFGKSPYSGSGTALENCRKRLELEFGSDGRLEIGPREKVGTRVLLSFPWTEVGNTQEGGGHAGTDRR